MTKHLAGWTVAVVALVLAASSAHAGRLPTPGKDKVRVGPFDEVTYTERFVGDEIALVTVDGDGSTQLEVDVYDQNGNLIDSDTGFSCVVSWTPLWTGKFKIKVINLGLDDNSYRLKTN